jgi:cytochrome P450
MRKMFNQAFTPRRINGLAPAIERMTRELLETLAGRETVDFMAEFAFPLPANVLGELMGIPEEHRAWYRPRALALGELLELGRNRPSVIRKADQAAVEITELFGKLAAQRREEPRDDLLTALVQAMEVDGEALSEEELLANLVVVFNAGFVTTTHLLGNGVTLLLDHPGPSQARARAPRIGTVLCGGNPSAGGADTLRCPLRGDRRDGRGRGHPAGQLGARVAGGGQP